MLKLYASHFSAMGAILANVAHREVENTTPDQLLPPHDLEQITTSLREILELCRQVELNVSATLAEKRLGEYAEEAPTYGRVKAAFQALEECIIAELRGYWLLYVPKHLTSLYEHGPEPFGPEVAERFPSAAYDIREACKCLATERDTAAVFHLMRVLEKALGALAQEHGIDFQFENWKNVIDQIESRIRDKEQQLPKGQAKSDLLQFQSEAAIQFRYFKEAWRNHVSRGRSQYESEEAANVFRHVQQFMRHLATKLAE